MKRTLTSDTVLTHPDQSHGEKNQRPDLALSRQDTPNSDLIDWNGADILTEPSGDTGIDISVTGPTVSAMRRPAPIVKVTKLTKPAPIDFSRLDLFSVYMSTINRLADEPPSGSLNPQPTNTR